MGKNRKKYALISGLLLNDNNRGTAALGYGAIDFLVERGFLTKRHELIKIQTYRNIFKKGNHYDYEKEYDIQGHLWKIKTFKIFYWEIFLLLRFQTTLPFSKLNGLLKQIDFVAAINGGDGFSDIYGTKTFERRLLESEIAVKAGVRHIILPQTIGPFKEKQNLERAVRILKNTERIYVRDRNFIKVLESLGLSYEITRDLSAYMRPQAIDIKILPNSIGLNVSGLCYSNRFRSLTGQFGEYPELIDSIISEFQKRGKHVYLIPHSYHYGDPEKENDDMEACQKVWDKLKDKKNVYFINKNLTSPQVKYIISKMSFFVGTRMHANFAAIYSDVPVFGLAYSYKFSGAFDANGLNGTEQTVMINNMKKSDVNTIVKKVLCVYNLLGIK